MSRIPDESASPHPSPETPGSRMSFVHYEAVTPSRSRALLRRRPAYRMRIGYPALQVTLADPRQHRGDDELQYRFAQTDRLMRELDERARDLSCSSRVEGGVIVAFTVRPRRHRSPDELIQELEAAVA